jgi:hypothetical protein
MVFISRPLCSSYQSRRSLRSLSRRSLAKRNPLTFQRDNNASLARSDLDLSYASSSPIDPLSILAVLAVAAAERLRQFRR